VDRPAKNLLNCPHARVRRQSCILRTIGRDNNRARRRAEIGGIERHAVIESLHIRNAGVGQMLHRALIADPLGDGLHSEGLGEFDHRLDENLIARIVGEILDESTVDLDNVDVQQLQILKRRVAGSEIVNGDPAAEFLQRVDKVDGLIDVFDRDRLGNFDDDAIQQFFAPAR